MDFRPAHVHPGLCRTEPAQEAFRLSAVQHDVRTMLRRSLYAPEPLSLPSSCSTTPTGLDFATRPNSTVQHPQTQAVAFSNEVLRAPLTPQVPHHLHLSGPEFYSPTNSPSRMHPCDRQSTQIDVHPSLDQFVELARTQCKAIRHQRHAWTRRRCERGRLSSRRTAKRRKSFLCFISVVFLASLLSIYLSIALTNHHLALPLHMLFILLIVSTLILFLHSLTRFCMLVLRPRHTTTTTTTSNPPPLRVNTRIPDALPHLSTSEHDDDDNDFTPTTPIRVHLARDEEVAIGDVQTEKDDEMDLAMPPPAYGLWRCSVRADPNLLHWRKAENNMSASYTHPAERLVRATSLPQLSRATGQGQSGLVRHGLETVDREGEEGGEEEEMRRPPSYASDDRVELAVAAVLRLGSPAVSEMIEVGRTR